MIRQWPRKIAHSLAVLTSLLLFIRCTQEQISPAPEPQEETSDFVESDDNIVFSFRPNGKKSKPLKAIYDKRSNTVTITSLPSPLQVLIEGEISSDHGGIAKDRSLKKGCQDIRKTFREALRNNAPFVKSDELKKLSKPLILTAPSLEITNTMQKAIFTRIKFPVGKPLPKIQFPDFQLDYKYRKVSFARFYPTQDKNHKELIDEMARGHQTPLSFALICDLITNYIRITAHFEDKAQSSIKANISWY